ncbi:proteasome assembly chaperone 2 [Athalia rosae]|uniref:proteasome assembly chaperone 2 n=1 Tax=Athalia rosae TaxID=37344 RepID=UPI0020333FAA|nr:proteasome assembly chaperone 2 [Athalia rosae]XP_012260682.2 proteasome assembly chaperone 2 [Athalia rosae]XP_048516017.1 proteasome assembly chaperone 2 [Athalia rosae]XP_048516018.1 proteasome assembly chaperone 2 [Athalia rosae]
MIKLKEEVDLTGYTLVLPSVAVGNVGQLAVDLFISSLNARRIGYIWSSEFIPIFGPDPYDENSSDLCTALDVFCSPEKKVLLLQIRSPLIKEPVIFFDELQNFIAEKNIAKVVILTSSYSHERRDHQIRTVPLRYLASQDIMLEHSEKFNRLNWTYLESKAVEDGSSEVLEIPGGGFAKALYDALLKIKIPCIVLLRFCSEGDNVPDAVELASYLDQWLQLFSKDVSGNLIITKPPSWKFLFGNNPPLEIF